MTARRSPLLPEGWASTDVILAIDTLENSPRIPLGTPLAGDRGFDGQVKRDENNLYIHTDGVWKFVSLTTLT